METMQSHGSQWLCGVLPALGIVAFDNDSSPEVEKLFQASKISLVSFFLIFKYHMKLVLDS